MAEGQEMTIDELRAALVEAQAFSEPDEDEPVPVWEGIGTLHRDGGGIVFGAGVRDTLPETGRYGVVLWRIGEAS